MTCGLHAVISGILAGGILGFRNVLIVSFAPTLAIVSCLLGVVFFWMACE